VKGGEKMKKELDICCICKKEHTSMHVEVAPGTVIYVCSNCIDKAKDNFIWLCMSCGRHYMRPKEVVINRVKDPELKRAYMLCKDMQIIQGIDMCIECDPERVVEYVETHKSASPC
jgi:hypothetical protein